MTAKVLARVVGLIVSLLALLVLLTGCPAPTPAPNPPDGSTPTPTPPDGTPPSPNPVVSFTITESASQLVMGKKYVDGNEPNPGWVTPVIGELVLKNGLFYRFVPSEKELEVVGAWADSPDARDIFGAAITRKAIFVSPGGRYVFAIRNDKVDVYKFSETTLLQKVGTVPLASQRLVLYNESDDGMLAFGLVVEGSSPPSVLRLYRTNGTELENVANVQINVQPNANSYIMHEFAGSPDGYYLEANLTRNTSSPQVWEGTLSIKKLMPDATVSTVFTHESTMLSYNPDVPTRYLTLWTSWGLSEYVNYSEDGDAYIYDTKRNRRVPQRHYPVFYIDTGTRGWLVESFYDVNPLELIDPITGESSTVQVVDKLGLALRNFYGSVPYYESFDYQRRTKWLDAFENRRIVENVGQYSPILFGSYSNGKIVLDYGAPKLYQGSGSRYIEVKALNVGVGAAVLGGAVFVTLDGGLFMLHRKSERQRLRFIGLGDTMTARDGKIWFAGASSIGGPVPVVGYYEPETDRFVYDRASDADEAQVLCVPRISVSNTKIAVLSDMRSPHADRIEIWDRATLKRERFWDLPPELWHINLQDIKRFKLTDDGKLLLAVDREVYVFDLRGRTLASAQLKNDAKFYTYNFNADITRDGSSMVFAILEPGGEDRHVHFAVVRLSETGESTITINDHISFPVKNMSLVKKFAIDKVVNVGPDRYETVPPFYYFNDGRHLLFWGTYGGLASDPLSLMVIDTQTEKVSSRLDLVEYGESLTSSLKFAHRSLLFDGDAYAAILLYNTENGEQFYRVFRISR